MHECSSLVPAAEKLQSAHTHSHTHSHTHTQKLVHRSTYKYAVHMHSYVWTHTCARKTLILPCAETQKRTCSCCLKWTSVSDFAVREMCNKAKEPDHLLLSFHMFLQQETQYQWQDGLLEIAQETKEVFWLSDAQLPVTLQWLRPLHNSSPWREKSIQMLNIKWCLSDSVALLNSNSKLSDDWLEMKQEVKPGILEACDSFQNSKDLFQITQWQNYFWLSYVVFLLWVMHHWQGVFEGLTPGAMRWKKMSP